MVPDIAGKGHSFAGAMAYYLHDKCQAGDASSRKSTSPRHRGSDRFCGQDDANKNDHPKTSERVAWTEIRNLPVDDPHMAIRLMIATASQAEDLKRRAGVKSTGRRSSKSVYAFSLSWHPQEAAGLNKAEMLRAANEALAALDASHLQCIIVCHTDQPHPHVHCILNRVDPNDGRMAVLSKDRERLSKWAHSYERERGPLLTPKRAEKYGPEAERVWKNREQADNMAAAKREPSPRAMLAQLDAAQRERYKQEWQQLGESYRAERKTILERHTSPKAMIVEHRKEHRVAVSVVRQRQAQERMAFDAQSRNLIGRTRLGWQAAKEA